MRIVLAGLWFFFVWHADALAQRVAVDLHYAASGHLIAPVGVNDAGTYAFIVDTAASRTVISPELALALSLVRLDDREGHLAAAGGETKTDVYQLGVLKLSEREWKIRSVLVLPDSTGLLGPSGILGLDVLAAQPVMLDFRAMKLSLLNRQSMRKIRRQGGWQKISVRQNFAGFLTINLKINGHRVTAVVDSGARRSIGNVKLGALLDNLSPASILAQEQIVTGVALPRVPARSGLARAIYFQGLRWNDAELLVADLAIFKTLNLDNKPALILGLDFLRQTSAVMIDFPRQRLWIKP